LTLPLERNAVRLSKTITVDVKIVALQCHSISIDEFLVSQTEAEVDIARIEVALIPVATGTTLRGAEQTQILR